MSETSDKLMKAEEVSLELKKILNDAKNKHPTSFFDIGKARHMIYSILMGFVLKYFIEHVYENREVILSLESSHFIAYACMLTYFFLNCFRFLFGLVDYSNMTDEKFAPQEGEWVRKHFFKNTLKQFVINTGVFQLIIFSFFVFYLFPHFESAETLTLEVKNRALLAAMPEIILNFCFSTLMLLVIDIFSLFLFRTYVANKDFKEDEQVRYLIWYFADWLETGATILLLISIGLTRPACATPWQNTFLIILTSLAFIETISVYKYFESPLMSFRDLIRKIKVAIKSWRGKE